MPNIEPHHLIRSNEVENVSKQFLTVADIHNPTESTHAHQKAQRGCGYYIHDRILILRIQMSWKPATFKHVSHEGYHVDPILSDRDH